MQVQSRFSILRQIRDWARRTERCPCCGRREGISDGHLSSEKEAGRGAVSRNQNSGNTSKQVSVKQILLAVSDASQIPVNTLLSKERTKVVGRWRQISYLLCRDLRRMSYAEIGQTFERNHTTILYGIGKITMLINEDSEAADEYEGLLNALSK